MLDVEESVYAAVGLATSSFKSRMETRIDDILHKYDEEEDRTTRLNLCESAAIYRINPSWFEDEAIKGTQEDDNVKSWVTNMDIFISKTSFEL